MKFNCNHKHCNRKDNCIKIIRAQTPLINRIEIIVATNARIDWPTPNTKS